MPPKSRVAAREVEQDHADQRRRADHRGSDDTSRIPLPGGDHHRTDREALRDLCRNTAMKYQKTNLISSWDAAAMEIPSKNVWIMNPPIPAYADRVEIRCSE